MESFSWRRETDHYTADVFTPEGEQGYLDAYFPPISGKQPVYILSLGVCKDKASCDIAGVTFESGVGITDSWCMEALRGYRSLLQGLPEDVRKVFMGMLEEEPAHVSY